MGIFNAVILKVIRYIQAHSFSLLDPVGYLPINSFNSKGNCQNLFNSM